MKRSWIVAIGAVLAVTPLGVAQAQDANAPLAVSIDASVCGQATILYTSTNTRAFSGDYRVDDEAGEADGVPADLEIREGPLAGTLFGLRFNPTPIPANSTVPVIVDFDEDQGGGEVSVSAWVNRGPEQRAFAAVVTATVDTDCEAPVVTTPPATPAPDEAVPTLPDDLTDDEDRPSLPDAAPRPVIVDADLPVTG